MFTIFRDSPEYTKRLNTPYKPPKITLAELNAVIPKHLHEKRMLKSLSYVIRDVLLTLILFNIGLTHLDPFIRSTSTVFSWGTWTRTTFRWALWLIYWFWQSIFFSSLWCLAHEAGHGALFRQSWLNHVIGYMLHTPLLVPYYAWRSSHHSHHKGTKSLEKEENYVPLTRSSYGLPPPPQSTPEDYHNVFEDTPLYNLSRILYMQLLGWQTYLFTNVMGNPAHPPGTNHFSPYSSLFRPAERPRIIISDIGLAIMTLLLATWTRQVGTSIFIKVYLVPYLLTHNWIVMLTFLNHTDPSLPLFRRGQWTFLRGALSTVDRPFLGWIGRVFFHNVAHDHIAHHIFSSTPSYNLPEITLILKTLLPDDYNYDSTNTFRALYRSFTQCRFVEDTGDIVFHKDSQGNAPRQLAPDALDEPVQAIAASGCMR